jgi:AcrR family transcriptional regulator
MERPREEEVPVRRPRGRRTDGADTREQIVAAARAEFVERGYALASVRGIARRAGVDPGLVRYWFPGGKAELLTNSLMHPAVNPAGMIGLVLDGPFETIGSRLVAVVLTVWEMPGGRERLRLVVGAAAAGEDSGAVRDYIAAEVLAKVAALVPGPDARLRVSLAASHLFGLLVARHVMGLEPLASAPVPDLVAWAGPTIQRYFEVTEPAELDPAWFMAGPPTGKHPGP